MAKIVRLLPIMSLLLSGCGNGIHHNEEDYITKIDYKNDFRLLVMGDIHLGNKDDLDHYFKFMDLTIDESNADLMIFNGDLFTFGDEATLKALFTYFDSKNIPWGVTYGNHDEQCFFTADYMSKYADSFENCVFKYNPDDDVYGYSNYCVNLVDGNETKFSIYCLDSNRYRYSPYIGYDYIHKDQIDWYERMVKYNGGSSVKSFACYHIPVPEFSTAWDYANDGSGKATIVPDTNGKVGEKREKVCSPKENSGFFAKEVELKSTIGNICSHDHINNFAVNYQDITLIYSVNSTGRIYGNPEIRGGTVVTIKNGESIEYTNIYHSESELTDEGGAK